MASQADGGLRVEVAGGVARLTLGRPERRNALSKNIVEALENAANWIADDRSVRAVVIAAEGPVFSAGHDLAELRGADEAEAGAIFEACTSMMIGWRRLPQPVIARVQGPALAAGCQLVAACDLAVAAESATFSTPGVKVGLFCATPMVPLVRAIAPRAALEMLLTGEPIAADRALALGLVNRVVTADRLDEAVDDLLRTLLAARPGVLARGKAAFYDGLGLDEPAAYERAVERIAADAPGVDAQEGIAAFLSRKR